MPQYLTLAGTGRAEYESRQSRFLALAVPIASETEIAAHLDALRREHRKANHHVFAACLGVSRQWQKASDDGEPSGTGGRPVLELLTRKELTDALVVVTRYFGGTLLGSGGLIRAYGTAALGAIQAAGVKAMGLHQKVTVRIDYSWLDTVLNWLAGTKQREAVKVYAEQVTLELPVRAEDCPRFERELAELTGGQADISIGESLYLGENRI